MSGRRIQPHYEGRVVPAPGMLRHGPFPGSPAGHRLLEPLPLLEDKIAVQAAEIERLARDNHRLAASHITMREDLAAAQQEIPRIKAHIRNIHTESDSHIRVLLDKIAKMEADCKAGERLKKDLQQAHIEAQSLARARQELTSKIQQASEALHKARLEVKNLPDLHAELDSLRQEHRRLRYAADVSTSKFLGFRFPLSHSFISLEVKAQFISDLDLTICFNLCGGENSATFEYEKGLNMSHSFISLEVTAQFISDLDLTICFNLCGGENSATFEYEKGLNMSHSFISLEVKAQFISDLDLTICFNLCGGENSATFEYEKGLNIDNVEQLQAMEKNLVGMAREMEKLHAEVVNAEMRGHAPNPYSRTYTNPIPSYPPSVQGGGVYVDGYSQPLLQMGVVQTGEGMIPYGSGNGVAAASGVGMPAVPASTVGAVWGGSYDP
ncbi:hypothetical protein WN944_002909 [Citrus x changshan-huyou]|uniref:Uncharacterized protein n=1 Tax=Citrus x changshan-huyou TaxID=2935761 RepID=A0AAP0QWA2_9ROSI